MYLSDLDFRWVLSSRSESACGGDSTTVTAPHELCAYWELEAKIYTQYNSNIAVFIFVKNFYARVFTRVLARQTWESSYQKCDFLKYRQTLDVASARAMPRETKIFYTRTRT